MIPAGVMVGFGGTTAPAGWLECDGSAVSRTGFSGLFAAIGTTWGSGDGVNTFNVPDLRRRAMVGAGGVGTGVLGNAEGNVGGTETHALVIAELAAHAHVVLDHTHSLTGSNNTAATGASNRARNDGGGVQAGTTGTMTGGPGSTDTIGSGTGHNNMQPSAVVMMIVSIGGSALDLTGLVEDSQ